MRLNRATFDAVLPVYLALALLVLPVHWVGAVILAAAVHEGSHYIAVRLCGGKIGKFGVGTVGAKLEAFRLSTGEELICALAGPVGGFALMLVSRWLPRTALCAVLQSLYNLLPVYPLDGGRALRCITQLLFPGIIGERLSGILERMCLVGIVLAGLYGSFVLRLGLIPLLFAAFLLYRVIGGKIACKAVAS